MISTWFHAALAGVLLSTAPVHPRIESFLDRTMPRGPGGTVAVARDGELVHCAGFGPADREAGIPAGCDTAYDIMSITKQFTAAAIMKLQMTGRLRTSDRISVHLGPVPADKRLITVRHLLTHTSGLSDLGDDYDPVSRDAMTRRALASPLRSKPGAEFHYSNVGYSLLAAVIERVSGMSYERFLAEHLFAPAGMTHTGYVLPRWARGQIAVEYDETGKRRGRPTEHPWAADGPYWYLRGNGGMLSTARDLYRWHRALEGDTVLSRRAKAEMFGAQVVVDRKAKLYYGYGWGVFPRTDHGRVVEHDGGNDWSYGDLARFLDKGVMVFWISNHAYRAGKWNLEELNGTLTLGLLRASMAS
ncbi:beta-lactamase family protein [Herbidospora galbida]|uniref:Beta-lactamase family protein n=1 Tax=Herbidospora galbida TaxID=2575442 RepID=A0A4U3MPJ0_9ACTN|nr:serine hydrolase domain-containing protein [Herbidospora galbida]TKK91531.1 beta-lactamase family protein [Herbidospora galbida]